MGRILISPGGGGGTSSDELTAKREHVLAGYTAVTKDSDDEAVAGTMPDNSTCTSNGTVPGINSSYPNVPTREADNLQYCEDVDGVNRINMCPPRGYYPGGGGSYIDRPAADFGNASASDVSANKTFTSSDGLNKNGSLAERGQYQNGGVAFCDTYFAINGLPEGIYRSNGASWAPEARCTAEQLRNALGIRGDIIKSGNSIAGIAGTLSVQSAINFSAAARSYNTIRISWTNPSKGPWSGVFIQMSTSGNPGTGGGTRAYTGKGENGSQAGGSNYVDINGLNYETKYYFTCTSYTHFNEINYDEWGVSYNVSATTPEWWDPNSSGSMAVWVNSSHFPKALNDVNGKFKSMAWSNEGAKAIAGSAYALNALGKNSRACMYMNMSAYVPKYYDTIVNTLQNTGYFDKKSAFSEIGTSEQSSTGNYVAYVIYSASPQGRKSTNSSTWESSLGNDAGSIVVINKYKSGYNAYTDPSRGYSGCDIRYYGGEQYNNQNFNMVFKKGRYFQGEESTDIYKKYVNAGLKSTWDSRYEWKYWGDGRETFTKNIVCFGPAILDNSCADEKSMIAYTYWWGNLYRCK